MSKRDNLSDYLNDLYRGIAKKRENPSRNPQDFRAEIEAIETKSPEWDGKYETSDDTVIVEGGSCPVPVLVKKTATENKTYKASEDGADGYSEVNVEVPMPVIVDASDVPITENGTYEAADYGADGISKFIVAVPETIPDGYVKPSGNKHITENGENIPVAEFETVSVDVASSCDRPLAFWFMTDNDQIYDYEWDEDDNPIETYRGVKESITVPPQVQDGSATSFERLFSCYYYDGPGFMDWLGGVWAKEICGVINCAGVTSLNGLFSECIHTERICPIINTENVTDFSYMFNVCARLISTPTIDIRSAEKAYSPFAGCYALESIDLKNIKISLDLSSSSKLTVDSLVGLCYELIDTGSTKTLTIGSTNLAKLQEVYVRAIEITDEMRAEDEFIDLKKPFRVLAPEEVEDGEANLPSYVSAFKNWSLK